MARVTVEDCLKNVRNRFELVIIAAKRARQIMRGGTPMVEIDNDKPTVIALREIAEGHTDFETHQTEEEREAAAMLSSLNAASEAKDQEASAEASLEGAAEAAAAAQAQAEQQPANEQPASEQPAEQTAAAEAQPEAPAEQAQPEQPATEEPQQPAPEDAGEPTDQQHKSDQE